MKCFAVLFVCWMIGERFVQQISSFSVVSLILPQLGFLDSKCSNVTGNETAFEDLKQAIEECQSIILNGTEIELSYDGLTNEKDPQEFYEFYRSQCSESNEIRFRSDCNDKFKYLLRQCLNDTESLAYDKVEDIALRIYRVVCGFDQGKMKNFFSLKGQECLNDNVVLIGFCFLSFIPGEDDDEREDFLFRLIEGKELKTIDDIEACMMGEIGLCEEQSVPYVFKRLFESFRSELDFAVPVEELKQEDRSSSTSPGVSSMIPLTSGFIALLLLFH